jgi:hypothetical protein
VQQLAVIDVLFAPKPSAVSQSDGAASGIGPSEESNPVFG